MFFNLVLPKFNICLVILYDRLGTNEKTLFGFCLWLGRRNWAWQYNWDKTFHNLRFDCDKDGSHRGWILRGPLVKTY